MGGAPKHFRVALAYASRSPERVAFVERVAGWLADKLGGPSRILYDRYHPAEFAHAEPEAHLRELVHEHAELLVVFLDEHHARCPWSGLPWATMREIIERHAPSPVMLIRFDATEPDPPLEFPGTLEVRERTSDEIAAAVLDRLDPDFGAPLPTPRGAWSGAAGMARPHPHEDPKTALLRTIPCRRLRHLPQLPAVSVARPRLCDAIEAELRRDHCVALEGPAGVGKSHLALEYAYSTIERRELTWAIDARDQTQLRVALAQLGHSLGIAEHVSTRELPEATTAWLRLQGDWLLVLDGVEDMEAIEALVPLHGPGHVVIVTHPRAVSPRWLPSVSVPSLTQPEAETLLRTLAGWAPHTPVAQLLHRIGTSPHPVAIAGRLAGLGDLDPSRVERIRAGASEAGRLAEYIRQAAPHGSVEQLLLNVCTFLGPVPIPLSVFLAPGFPREGRLAKGLPREPEPLARTARRLAELGLATVLDETITVDPRVADTVIDLEAPHRRAWEQLALEIASALYQRQGFISRFDDDALDPALVALVRHVARETKPTPKRLTRIVRLKVASAAVYAGYSHEPTRALAEFERAIELVERYAEEPTANLAMLHFNAGLHRFGRGDLQEADAAFESAMELLPVSSEQGAQLRMVVTLYLARTHGRQGRPERATRDYQAFFVAARRCEGVLRHAEVMGFLDDLFTYWLADDRSTRSVETILEALEMLPEITAVGSRPDIAHEVSRFAARFSGTEHHRTSQRLLALAIEIASWHPVGHRMAHALATAHMFHDLGRPDEEEQVLELVSRLLTHERLPAPAHGSYWADYADRLADAGDHAAAAEYQRCALDELEGHPRARATTIALAVHDLSCHLHAMGRMDDATAVYADRLDLDALEEVPATCLLLLGLARLWWSGGHPDSVGIHERAAELYLRTQGSSDPGTLMVRAELARHLMEADAMDRAEPHARAVAEHLLDGPYPPGVQVDALARLVTIELARGNVAAAREMLGRVLDLLTRRPAAQDEDIRTTSAVLSRLAVTLAEHGLSGEALRVGTESFECHRRVQARPDSHTIELAHEIGLMLQRAERPSLAVAWFEDAANLAEAIEDVAWRDKSREHAAAARAQGT